jgi:hypothetical protein
MVTNSYPASAAGFRNLLSHVASEVEKTRISWGAANISEPTPIACLASLKNKTYELHSPPKK